MNRDNLSSMFMKVFSTIKIKDIPGNCIVGGVPAKLLKYKE